MGACGVDLCNEGKGQLVGYCEYGNELWHSIKYRNSFTWWGTRNFL